MFLWAEQNALILLSSWITPLSTSQDPLEILCRNQTLGKRVYNLTCEVQVTDPTTHLLDGPGILGGALLRGDFAKQLPAGSTLAGGPLLPGEEAPGGPNMQKIKQTFRKIEKKK